VILTNCSWMLLLKKHTHSLVNYLFFLIKWFVLVLVNYNVFNHVFALQIFSYNHTLSFHIIVSIFLLEKVLILTLTKSNLSCFGSTFCAFTSDLRNFCQMQVGFSPRNSPKIFIILALTYNSMSRLTLYYMAWRKVMDSFLIWIPTF
jgi:hypothetical protein